MPFTSSLQHIFAELERVDLFLRAQIWRLRQAKRDDKFEGLYISDQEIDEQLERPIGVPRWASDAAPVAPKHDEQLARLRAELAAGQEAALAAGVRLRLAELVAQFQLTPFDRNVVLLCLAPEVEPRYERMFAYLQDDVTRRRPGVNLVLDLICPTLDDKLAARARFEAGAPLLQHGIVELFEEPTQPQPTQLGRYLRLDPRIAGHLLDSDAIAPELVGLVQQFPCVGGEQVPPSGAAALERIVARHDRRQPLFVNVVGPRGGGKKSWTRAVCAELGYDLLVARVPALLAGGPGEALKRLRMVNREADLLRAAVFWEGVDALGQDEHAVLIAGLLATERRGLTFLGSTRPWLSVDHALDLPFTRVELPLATYTERVLLWRQELAADLPAEIAAEVPAIATKFRFSGGQIRAAAASARSRARWRPDGPALRVDDVYAGCRAQSGLKLGELARVLRPRYRWSDIVLPEDSLGLLREICERVRLRGRVHEEWGFDTKLSLGKGVNLLFSGPSGTGKTMAAEVLAHELNLDLYKIDLAGVVSKYIGETEKNLSRIFAEAETSNAILFFDEADALFGKRSEVKDAHDRYANIETSYLLQRMEEYEGLTILSTNLRKNLDEAFVRRMAFTLSFSLPEEAERLDIWRKVWPKQTPLDAGLDLEFMAHQFKFSGGNIKNIAIAAAFLAASDGTSVGMVHLIKGTKREMQKSSRLCVPSDFGKYAALAE